MKCLSWRCNNEATNKVFVNVINGKSVFKYYCDDCVKSFAVCEKCGVHINTIGLSMNQCHIDGRYVCWDCIKSTKFHKCHRCSNSVFDDAEYCLNCKNKPCQTGCPLQNNIPDFIKYIKEENVDTEYINVLKELEKEVLQASAKGVN